MELIGVSFFTLVAIGFGIIAYVTAKILRPRRPGYEKNLSYECGEDAQGSPYVRLSIKYYIIALLFLIFGVELVLIIPWITTLPDKNWFIYISGLIFIGLLILGLAYEWKKGDLDWNEKTAEPENGD